MKTVTPINSQIIIDEVLTGSGTVVEEFILRADTFLISVDVTAVSGTLDIKAETFDEATGSALEVITVPTISSPTSELQIFKSPYSLDKVRITVTYTDACTFRVLARGTYDTSAVMRDAETGESAKITHGGLDVNVQDQTTPVVVLPVNINTNTTLLTAIALAEQYDITVASTTGISIGSYIRIISPATERLYVGFVLAVNGLVVTMDRYLDSDLPVDAIVDVCFTNMNVDGSVTPQIFGVRNSPTSAQLSGTIDITRMMFGCRTTNAVDLSKFGDLPALIRGIQIRRTDGITVNIFNAKTNGELATLMYDFTIYDAQNSQQGQNGFLGRLTFGGPSKIGVVVRLGPGEDLEVIIQDDLSDLERFEIVLEGHVVE